MQSCSEVVNQNVLDAISSSIQETNASAPLQPIISTAPFKLVSMDYVHFEPSSGGYQYILVIMDHYTRFAQAYASRDKSTKPAADKLNNYFIMRFECPETIHHD